jgi:hypothetical protein
MFDDLIRNHAPAKARAAKAERRIEHFPRLPPKCALGVGAGRCDFVHDKPSVPFCVGTPESQAAGPAKKLALSLCARQHRSRGFVVQREPGGCVHRRYRHLDGEGCVGRERPHNFNQRQATFTGR